jgi:hypothetical protein
MAPDAAFPPHPTLPSEVAATVEALASVVDDRTAIYVSSPLTTGRLAFEWHQRNGGEAEPSDPGFQRSVVDANRRAAAAYVARVRAATEAVVIDPTAMDDVQGWTQDDYRFFWGTVIERYVQVLILRDGWEHSSGCSYECLVAFRDGLQVLREDRQPLSLADARRLLRDAIERRAAHPETAGFLTAVLGALERLPTRQEAS